MAGGEGARGFQGTAQGPPVSPGSLLYQDMLGLTTHERIRWGDGNPPPTSSACESKWQLLVSLVMITSAAICCLLC